MPDVFEASEIKNRLTATRLSVARRLDEALGATTLPEGWSANRHSEYTIFVQERAAPYRNIKVFVEYDLGITVTHEFGTREAARSTVRKHTSLNAAVAAVQTLLLFY